MKPKHTPTRTCVGCRTTQAKKELIRIVRTPEGTVEFDKTGKKSGRGAYVCVSRDCLDKSIKGKQLERALKCAIDESIKDTLEREFHE